MAYRAPHTIITDVEVIIAFPSELITGRGQEILTNYGWEPLLTVRPLTDDPDFDYEVSTHMATIRVTFDAVFYVRPPARKREYVSRAPIAAATLDHR